MVGARKRELRSGWEALQGDIHLKPRRGRKCGGTSRQLAHASLRISRFKFWPRPTYMAGFIISILAKSVSLIHELSVLFLHILRKRSVKEMLKSSLFKSHKESDIFAQAILKTAVSGKPTGIEIIFSYRFSVARSVTPLVCRALQ